MADPVLSYDQLRAGLADNTTGDIGAADSEALVTSLSPPFINVSSSWNDPTTIDVTYTGVTTSAFQWQTVPMGSFPNIAGNKQPDLFDWKPLSDAIAWLPVALPQIGSVVGTLNAVMADPEPGGQIRVDDAVEVAARINFGGGRALGGNNVGLAWDGFVISQRCEALNQVLQGEDIVMELGVRTITGAARDMTVQYFDARLAVLTQPLRSDVVPI